MQTVNFQCGHCGKLMGVGSEYLGQQVRCPHCQQVVVAPPLAPTNPPPAMAPTEPVPQPTATETVVQAPPLADHEDIFAPPEATDDLFGRTEVPRIEIPADSLAPTVATQGSPAASQPPEEPTVTATVPYSPSEAAMSGPPANGEGTAILPSSGGEAPWMAATVTEMLPSSPAEASAPAPESFTAAPSTPSAARPARRSESGTPWFMILVFSPLLLYSIVITVFAVLLYMQERDVEQKLRNRFETMPDEGDNPGVQKGKKVTRFYRYDPKLATMPLPDNLITSLGEKEGESIRIGELQITPTRVERKRVNVFVEGSEKSEPCMGDSLVLRLKLKNLSSEYAFAPLDNYFDRFWKTGTDQLPPFTQLEAGDKRFYGGPAQWYPRGDTKNRREWVEGRKAVEPELLQPGEEKEFFVCTDGQDPKAVLTLFGENKGEKIRAPYHGSLLWRVRVRRGLVNILGKEVPATAVVGVRFTDKAIH